MFLQGETPQSDPVLFLQAFGRPRWTEHGSQSTPTNRKVHPVLFRATTLQPQKTPERPESAPVLFFTSILGPKSMLCCFLQAFWRPCHCRRNAPKLGQPPPTAAEPPWPVWRQSDLMKKQGFRPSDTYLGPPWSCLGPSWACPELSGTCLGPSWTQSSTQEAPKNHQVHPVLFFARNL